MDPTMNKQLFFTNKQSNHVIPNLVRQDIPQSLGLSFESSTEIETLSISFFKWLKESPAISIRELIIGLDT